MWTYLSGFIGWFGFTILKFAITPSIMIGAGYTFWETWITTSFSAVVGVTVFYFFGDAIFNWIDSRRRRPKKIFTKGNRRLVRTLRRYGLAGLALLSVVLSVPIAGLVAARFFHKPRVVLPVLHVAFTGWSLILTSLSHFIGQSI